MDETRFSDIRADVKEVTIQIARISTIIWFVGCLMTIAIPLLSEFLHGLLHGASR
jgi:hypothetical protein